MNTASAAREDHNHHPAAPTMGRVGASLSAATLVNQPIGCHHVSSSHATGQIAELEGHVDDAADMIHDVQQNPRGPRGRQSVGYDAFAGQGRRIRSPTPTPGDRSAQGADQSVSQGGGDRLTDEVLRNSRRDVASGQPHQVNRVNRRSVSPSVSAASGVLGPLGPGRSSQRDRVCPGMLRLPDRRGDSLLGLLIDPVASLPRQENAGSGVTGARQTPQTRQGQAYVMGSAPLRSGWPSC